MRSRWLFLLLLALTGSGCGGEVSDAPNVLLISIDTLRADRLGSYGFGRDTSPAIDALAADGVLFERAISGASSTAPSHASIFTSGYTREHTIGHGNGSTRIEGGVTLAEAFRQAGYRTAAFVGNVVLNRRIGFDRGFELYDDELPSAEVNRPEIFERVARQTTERTLEWLKQRRESPFLLWVHYQDPHGPYTPPDEFARRFRPEPRSDERALPVRDDLRGDGGIPSYQALDGMRFPSFYEARYAAEIAYTDHWIGRLLEAVDAASTGTGVIVVLTADHGESLGEEGRYFVHGTSTTPDQAHVPLILRAPGLETARRAEIVHHVDILPTLLELAGIAVPTGASGVALGPVLRGEAPMPDRAVYCDDGARLSAYGGGGFVRVSGVGGAWPTEGSEREGSLTPGWAEFTWLPDGSWVGGAPAEDIPRETVRSYFREAVPMTDADPYSATLKKMLRALGYGE